MTTSAVIPAQEQAQQVLRDIFGYQQFRPGQEAIIHAALAGRDCLVIMPTGVGNPSVIRSPRWSAKA